MKEHLEQFDTEMKEWFRPSIQRDFEELRALTSVPVRLVNETGLAFREYHPARPR